MGKWTKNYSMQIGAVLLVLGLALTAVSWTLRFAPDVGWLQSYGTLVQRPEGDWNLLVMIVGPILLIWGGFLVGEQIVLRRRFERLIDTPKRSEFVSRRRDLEDLAKRLPDGYGRRVRAKEAEFSAKRTA